jgi:hypothetical protein
MRVVVLVVCFCVASGAGCAETSACPAEERLVDGVCAPEPRSCEEATTKLIPVGCVFPSSRDPTGPPARTFGSWELTVDPLRIESGKSFVPIVGGKMLFGTSLINQALSVFEVGFTRVELSNVEARIAVRNAEAVEGREVTLETSIPMSCTYDEDGKRGIDAGPYPSCSDDSDCPDVPGEPDANRCALFADFDISLDCDLGGRCEKAGATGMGSPCQLHGFCAVGTAEIPLKTRGADIYRADGPGSVLFGYAEEVDVIESGIDRGAFDLAAEVRTPGQKVRLSGFDSKLGGLLTATFECAMGVVSRGSAGPPTTNALLSPAPSGALISCPIEGP